MLYANILVISGASKADLDRIKTFIGESGAIVERIDATFFLEITSIDLRKSLIAYLDGQGFTYLWYFNKIASGSRVYTGKIDPVLFDKIENIML